MPSRDAIRKEMRAKRRALSEAERRRCAELFALNFTRTNLYRNSKKIACYLANDGELDLQPLMECAWQDKKHIYLPVLHAPFADRLLFARYEQRTPLIYNRFGIAEPAVAARRRIKPKNLDLVLTPLVAFDSAGNRIGMGGGFYDRSFEFLRHRRYWHKPILVGCAYELQQAENIQPEKWDVPLAMIITDSTVLRT